MTATTEAASSRRTAWLLFVLLFAVFALGAQGGIVNPDAEVEFQTARSIFLRGSTGLSDDHPDASSAEIGIVRHVPAPGRRGFDCMQGVDGAYYSWFGLGHALVLVPFYAAGRAAAAVFPDVERVALERALEDARRFGAPEALARAFAEEFFSRFFASFHSALFAAGLGLLLFLILGHFGFSVRVRAVATLIACLTTQLWPGAREGMSDITAGFFLLASVERVLAWRHAGGGAPALVLAGALGGFSVLCRFGQLLPFAAVGVYVLCFALRRPKDVLAFALAAAPFGAWLLAFNYARFGDPFETGYSAGTSDGYWHFPFYLGFLFLLAAPGKGALVFSPLLAIVPRGLRELWQPRRADVVLVLAVLVLPWVLSSFMTGWHSSQAWASRYMTVGSVLVIGLGVAALADLAVREPGRGRIARRLVPLLAVLGFAINLGGNLTHYRGYYDLGSHAWQERWKDLDPREDLFQRAVLAPRLSPAIGHWLYAIESARGRLPASDAEAEASWSSVYGVVPRGEGGRVIPQTLTYVEDREFRHLWWIGLSKRFGASLPAVLAALLALLALIAGVVLRKTLR